MYAACRVLAHDVGLHDQIQGTQTGSSIVSRISDASLLVGNLDKALEYSSEEVCEPPVRATRKLKPLGGCSRGAPELFVQKASTGGKYNF